MGTAVMPAPSGAQKGAKSTQPRQQRRKPPTFNFSDDTLSIGQLAGKVQTRLSKEEMEKLRDGIKDRYGFTREDLAALVAQYRMNFSDARGSSPKNGPCFVRQRLEERARFVLNNWSQKPR